MIIVVCAVDSRCVGCTVGYAAGRRVVSNCLLRDDSVFRYGDGVFMSCEAERIFLEGFDMIFPFLLDNFDARLPCRFVIFLCVVISSIGVELGPTDTSSGALINGGICLEMHFCSG